MPDPTVLASLQLPIISAEEAGNATLAASESLGNPGGEEVPLGPVLKAGTSHNPAKGKQPAQGKQPAKGKQPAQDKPPPEQPFILGEGLPTVAAKLAGRIRRGEFVDMTELLQDNIEAERRRGSVPDNTCAGGVGKARRQEVPDLLSWVQCFGVYACVVASKHPEKISEKMAYQTTIIHEARRCGGAGWQGYDNMFRQHAANLPSIDWSKVNNSLFAVTFMAQQNGRGKTCELCLEPDHMAAECALAPAKPREPPTQRQPAGLGIVPAGQCRAGSSREWRSRDEYSGPRGQARAVSSTAATGTSAPVVGEITRLWSALCIHHQLPGPGRAQTHPREVVSCRGGARPGSTGEQRGRCCVCFSHMYLASRMVLFGCA